MAENKNPEPGWSYKPDDTPANQQANAAQLPQPPSNSDPHPDQAKLSESVNWTASEFVSNHKDAKWHAGYLTVLIIALILIYAFTRDVISVVVISIMGILLLVLANHKPRQLPYEVNNKGIGIGNKFHTYEQFKSFSLSTEEAVGCINFMPLHRFTPEISIYFPPDEGDKILDIISRHIPNDQTQEKKVDRMFKKIRF
ncbi:hypothetical protein KY385_01370 [Candidatus Parcubacteria bacterium]|nr:hypothetical protein [Candidatus Parcubacteria bacterium]